jgi:hypothetical protein
MENGKEEIGTFKFLMIWQKKTMEDFKSGELRSLSPTYFVISKLFNRSK